MNQLSFFITQKHKHGDLIYLEAHGTLTTHLACTSDYDQQFACNSWDLNVWPWLNDYHCHHGTLATRGPQSRQIRKPVCCQLSIPLYQPKKPSIKGKNIKHLSQLGKFFGTCIRPRYIRDHLQTLKIALPMSCSYHIAPFIINIVPWWICFKFLVKLMKMSSKRPAWLDQRGNNGRRKYLCCVHLTRD